MLTWCIQLGSTTFISIGDSMQIKLRSFELKVPVHHQMSMQRKFCLCSLLWYNYCTFLSIHVQNTMFLREEEGRARSAGMKNPLIYRAARGPSQWSNTIVCSSSATPFKNEPMQSFYLWALFYPACNCVQPHMPLCLTKSELIYRIRQSSKKFFFNSTGF